MVLLLIPGLVSLACCVVVITITILRFQSRETDLWEGFFRGLFECLSVLMALPIQLVSYRKEDWMKMLGTAFVSLYLAKNIRETHVCGNKYKKVDLSQKVFIVTGSNTGIGYDTAKALLEMGATVVMACRSMDRANAAKEKLISETKVSDAKVICIKLDLCGFDSVRKFVKTFRDLGLPLHCLINNAGLMMESRTLTQDGFEMVFTANHLSHFLLTNLLLPDLEKTNGRIVVVSSSMHKCVEKFDFDNVMSEKQYTLFGTYSQSKLANMLFAFEMQRRLFTKGSKVTCNVVHPGIVTTEVTRHMNVVVRTLESLFSFLLTWVRKTPAEGAYTSVHAAVADELNGKGGLYFQNATQARPSKGALDKDAAGKLWALSEQLTGLKQYVDK